VSVAVVITCFNEGPFITKAVQSVLDQTAAHEIHEIIIIDDGSDHSTLKVLQTLPQIDPRIRLIAEQGQEEKKSINLGRNRNIAVSRSKSEYIAFLDGDDFWSPQKTALQLALLRSDNSIGLTYGSPIQFSNDAYDQGKIASVRDLRNSVDPTLDYFLHDAPIVPSSVLMRRSVFDLVGGFDVTIPVFEDTEFYLRLSRVCRLAAVPGAVFYKRVHSGAITSKRASLMRHHANVAFSFAAQEPRLYPYVGKRLAERARKLGNLEAQDGRRDKALGFYDLALSLDPFNAAARASRLLLKWGGRRGMGTLSALRSLQISKEPHS
jgi:glycosyltransferase involved in cell wall biosynthesis